MSARRRATTVLAALGVLITASCGRPAPAAPSRGDGRSATPAEEPPVIAPGEPVIATEDAGSAVEQEAFEVELDKMTKQHWIEERLAALEPPRGWPRLRTMPREETVAFADGLLRKLREPVQGAVLVAMGPEQHPSVRENAWHLLGQLEEMAITPLAEARFPDAHDRVARPRLRSRPIPLSGRRLPRASSPCSPTAPVRRLPPGRRSTR